MIGRPRSVGLSGRPLKTELHHWWPKGLSKFWADTDGKVVRRAWNGEERRIPPAKLGAITNGHLIKIGGPWTTTVEPLFNDADSNFPRMVGKLRQLPLAQPSDGRTIESRFSAHDLDENERRLMGESLASLLIRCPAHRNLIHLTVQRINGRFGAQPQAEHDDTLIAGNIHQHYSQIVASLAGRGKLVFLRSPENEFVMGEGYLSTLAGYTIQLQYHCLLPLTPDLAVLAFAPLACNASPVACSVTLTTQEVSLLNKVTQIYSRDFIFYQRKPQHIIPEFEQREFLTLKEHRFPWLDSMMEYVSWYAPAR